MSVLLLAISPFTSKSCVVFNKNYSFIKNLEAICDRYKINVLTAKKCIIERPKFPLRYEFGFGNWQKKRICVDLSFLLVVYGMKPLNSLSKNVKPTKFVRNLMKDVKVHEDELMLSLTSSEIDVEKLSEEEKQNSIGVSGKEISEVVKVLNENIKNIKEKASKMKKKKEKMAESHKILRLDGLKTNIKNILKPDYLIQEKEIDKNPMLRRAAVMNGNIVKEKEESNINKEKLSYKDILLKKPITISGSYGSSYGIYNSAGLLKECQESYSYTVQKKNEDVKRLKLSVINSELFAVESELEKISHLKYNVYEEEKRKERRISKSYFTERRRVLRMLVQDNSKPSNPPATGEKKVGIAHCVDTLSEFAKVIKSVETERKNHGSRFRILCDLETEEIGGVMKGRIFKKEKEEEKGKEKEEVFDLEKEKAVVRYRLKSFLSKKAKTQESGKQKEKGGKASKMVRKIDKFKNKRKERRTKLLKETTENQMDVKKINSFMTKIEHYKRGDSHIESIHPKRKEKVVLQPRKFVKVMEKYIPRELLSFKVEESRELDFNIYNTPKEWLEHVIQLKINKIRVVKLIE